MFRLLKLLANVLLVSGAVMLFFMGLIKVPLSPPPPPPSLSPPVLALTLRPEPSNQEHLLEPLPTASVDLTCLENFVTVNYGGRLANELLEYAAAWAVGHIYHLSVTVPMKNMKYVGAVYTNLSATILEDEVKRGACAGTNLTAEKVLQHAALDNYLPMSRHVLRARLARQPVILRTCLVLFDTIIHALNDLRKEFTLREEFVKTTQETLENVHKKMEEEFGKKEVVLVGVHVRRTDYNQYLRRKIHLESGAGVEYYRKAAALMRSYSSSTSSATNTALAFVVTSDDPKWCETNLIPLLKMDAQAANPPSSVFLVSRNKSMHPGHDLALLSSCHNSIITYGTYGIWTALMAGGRTIVYDVRSPKVKGMTTAMVMAIRLPTWVLLS